MSTPRLPSTESGAEASDVELDLPECDKVTLQLADQDECVVNRTSGARGTLAGIGLGALLWAGLILAGAALIR